jgi:hypothetical protein
MSRAMWAAIIGCVAVCVAAEGLGIIKKAVNDLQAKPCRKCNSKSNSHKNDKNSPTMSAVACELGNGIAAVGFGSWLFTVALVGPQDTLLGFMLFMDDVFNKLSARGR